MKKVIAGLLIGAFIATAFTGCSPREQSAKKPRHPKVASLFDLALTLDTGKEPSFVIAEDFNKDGRPDIAVANSAAHSFSFFRSRDGGFDDPVVYKAGEEPFVLAAADFNRDGYPDIAVLSYASQDLQVFLNTHTGGFRNTGSIVKPGKIPVNMTVGDFNGDGIPDIAVSLRFHKVVILSGVGDGTFKVSQSLSTRGQPTGLAVADYNKDGLPDIAVGLGGMGNVGLQFFWGRGKGEFTPSEVIKGGGQPLTVLTLDANGDGFTDLVTTSNALHALTTVLNEQGKGFRALRDFSAGEFPKFSAIGDFNGDGIPDIAVSISSSNILSIERGNGDGTFEYPPIVQPVAGYPQGIAVADFNGDGISDLAVSSRDAMQVAVLLGRIPRQIREPAPASGEKNP